MMADLERYRDYLQILAEARLPSALARKLDAADLVQQTFAQAMQGIDGLRGLEEAQVAAWLRKILANTLAGAVRDLRRNKRDIAREQSIESALEKSSGRLEAWLGTSRSSPSQKAQHNEQVLQVAAALAELPEAQRRAVTLHHLGDGSLAEVAEHLERTPAAAAGLIKRGLKALRERLDGNNSNA